MTSWDPSGRSSVRFSASRKWAQFASLFNHPTTLSAYCQAMELVPKVIWVGSMITRLYDSIHTICTVTFEAATAAISASQYGLALEWLEAGRSIIWNQTLQLRAEFEELSTVAPILAKTLRQVAQELETVGRGDIAAATTDLQALEVIAQRHHRLAEQYKQKLVEA